MGQWLAIAVVNGLFCSTTALADKPVKPPKPGDEVESSYELIDLLGFPGVGCQSQGRFITHRDENGDVLIGGASVFFYPDGTWAGFPALWHVDINGDFPETDPISLGMAEDGTGREARGLSRCCSGVMVTDTALCFQQYEDGTWVSPSHVAFPDEEHRELPGTGLYYRNTRVSGINDVGQIVGTHELGGGMWQLNTDRTVSGPISLGEFQPDAINNLGVVAGRSTTGHPAIAWFKDNELVVHVLESDDPRYSWADVNALNDCPVGDPRLTVVGECYEDGVGEAFAWRPFASVYPTILLGKLDPGRTSVALDVNAHGEIVGWAGTKRQGHQAFIYVDGVLFNLNDLTDGRNTLEWAYGINDDGDIVGFMRVPRPISEQRGFLLRCKDSN
jgi:probable HAF family extracellular repeat protein